MLLSQFVTDFATAMKEVDQCCPPATSARTSRIYQAGIGPYSEARAVELVVGELKRMSPHTYLTLRTGIQYPGSRLTSDLALGEPIEWVFEIKMARFLGDNNKPDDTAIKDILSPFGVDRSAVTDCEKLLQMGPNVRKAVIIYAFEAPNRPLPLIVRAFELLAGSRVVLGPIESAPLQQLKHPVHSTASVFGWEILGLCPSPRASP